MAKTSALRQILRISDAVVSGPSPTFGPSHILLALLTIGDSTYVGREALAEGTGLGKGAVRTVLKKLRNAGYVNAVRSGCFVTPRGRRLLEGVHVGISGFVEVSGSGLTVGGSEVAIALRGLGDEVGTGIEQRDAAIRVGASGVTTYVIQKGRFTVPGGSSDCEKDFPGQSWKKLRSELKPVNGDVVILCGAPGEIAARLGALSAAMTLV